MISGGTAITTTSANSRFHWLVNWLSKLNSVSCAVEDQPQGATRDAPGYARQEQSRRGGSAITTWDATHDFASRWRVEATPDGVAIESPVPVVLELEGRPAQALRAGRHEVASNRSAV